MSAHPNTFLIGAPKCGTTALAQFLSEHPDVFMGYPKEPSYWSFDLRRGEGVLKLDDLESYLSIYADAGKAKVVLDGSTSYMYSTEALPKILEFAPNARFLILLRNPVEMVQAYHMEKCFNLYEDEEDFQKAWNLQAVRRQGQQVPKLCPEPKELQYGAVAALGTQLQFALDVLSQEQVLVLFQEDFAANPGAIWTRVLNFLELNDNGRTEFPVVAGSHFNRFPWLARFYQNPPALIAPLIRGLKKAARSGLGKTALSKVKGILLKDKTRDDISDTFKQELVEFFAPEVKKMEELTGRDLTHWKV